MTILVKHSTSDRSQLYVIRARLMKGVGVVEVLTVDRLYMWVNKL